MDGKNLRVYAKLRKVRIQKEIRDVNLRNEDRCSSEKRPPEIREKQE